MLRFTIFALLVAAATASFLPFGVVEDYVSCGSGQGRLVEVRFTNCTGRPCVIVKGETYDVEMDFAPSVEHEELSFIFSNFQGGNETEIISGTIPASVSPGNTYNFRYPWTVQLEKGTFPLRVQLHNEGVVEVCFIITADVQEKSF